MPDTRKAPAHDGTPYGTRQETSVQP